MKLDNRGISLVQVIVTAATLSVAALVGIKMMRLQMKVAKTTAIRFEVSYIMEEMVALLADPISCSASLQGLKPGGDSERLSFLSQEVIDPNSKDTLRLRWFETFDHGEKLYGQELVKIKEYKLSDKSKDVDIDQGTTNLIVTFDRGEKALGGQFVNKTIKLNIKTENGNIESCRASRNPPRRVKSNFTWKYDFSESHVFYDRGPVGINTPSLYTSLAVKGPVQLVEADETACVTGIEGAIRYDGKNKKIMFCDGSGNWKPLGQHQINWNEPIHYTLLANGSRNNSMTTGAHKRCFLSSINKEGDVKCKVAPARNKLWSLQAQTIKGTEQYRCVASCYN